MISLSSLGRLFLGLVLVSGCESINKPLPLPARSAEVMSSSTPTPLPTASPTVAATPTPKPSPTFDPNVPLSHQVEVVTVYGDGKAARRDGQGRESSFNSPVSLYFDEQDNLYAVERYAIRKITPEGEVSTILQDFMLKEPLKTIESQVPELHTLISPSGITMDQEGNFYVAEGYRPLIYKITPKGNLTIFAGNGESDYIDGRGQESRFKIIRDIVFDKVRQVLYVSDSGNDRIRQVDLEGNVTTLLGIGDIRGRYLLGIHPPIPARDVFLSSPGALALVKEELYINDLSNLLIRKLNLETQTVEQVVGFGRRNPDGFSEGRLEAPEGYGMIGFESVPYLQDLRGLIGLTVHDQIIFFSQNILSFDSASDYDFSMKVLKNNQVRTLVKANHSGYKDGRGHEAQFGEYTRLACNSKGELFVVDGGNHVIRKIILPPGFLD